MTRTTLFPWPALLTIIVLLVIGGVCWWLTPRQPKHETATLPPPPPPVEVSGDLAITNTTVIEVETGVPRPLMTVVIKGDRIRHVLPSADCRVVDGTKVIDGTGKFLIPGLWDMHVHLVQESLLPMFVQNGVTGVRHMFSYNPWYRPAPPAVPGPAVSPRIVAACQLLDGPDTPFSFPSKQNVVIAKNATAARTGVRELQKRGNHFVKVYATLSKEAYFAALDEAKTLGLPVCGHLPHAVTAAEACEMGQLTIEHLGGVAIGCATDEARLLAELQVKRPDGTPTDAATGWRVEVKAHECFSPAKAELLFAKFKKRGTWHTPTQVVTRATATLAEEHFPDPGKAMPPLVAEFWKREFKDGGVRLPLLGLSFSKADLAEWKGLFAKDLELVRQMHKAGVPMLAGTDTPAPDVVPGHSLHDELALFVEAGMTPAEALRTATMNPSRCLGREKELGTIEVGKYADLVLLSADPLADIHNTRSIELVTVGGRVVPR